MQAFMEFLEALVHFWQGLSNGIGIPVGWLTTLAAIGAGTVGALARLSARRAAKLRAVEAERDDLRKQLTSMPGNESPDNTLWASLNRFSDGTHPQIPGLLVMNMKGGVGKTTISGNLALSIAQTGRRVLLVDLDLQGSLSNDLISDRALIHREAQGLHPKDALGDLLSLGYTPDTLRDLAFPIRAVGDGAEDPDVHLLSADYELSEVEDKLLFSAFQNQQDVVGLLAKAIAAHNAASDAPYDFVIFDGPPRFSLATANALKAASHVLIPTRPEVISIRAVRQMLTFLGDREGELQHRLDLAGVVINEVRGNIGRGAEAVIKELEGFEYRYGKLGTHILPQRIPKLAIVGNPGDAPLVYQASGSDADRLRAVFDDLRDEILTRMGVIS